MQTRSSSRLVSNPSSNPTPSTNLNPKGRNRRRSKQRIEEFNLDELSPPIVTMDDQRTMAQLLQAPTEGYEDAIVVPAITADNFELKHARIWLEKEPPQSTFTWDDLVSKFINQLFPPSKTTNLRNEITNFQQRFNESFSEAWDRFKDLLKACPHHGFSKLHQSDTFYNALNSKDQDSLNSAAGGNFLDKIPRECLAIIESKSKVHYSRNKPVVAKVSMNTSTSGISPDVVELKDMVKALLLDKKSQNQSPPTVKAEDFPANVKANDAVMRNMQTQSQNMQNQLINLTELITKFVNSNSASTSSSGALPSNTIANPRSDLKAITTRSDVFYDGPQIPHSPSFLFKVVENKPEAIKDTVHPNNNESTEDIQPQVVQSKSLILTSGPVNSPTIEPVTYPVSAPRPNLRPTIAYPSRMQDHKLRDKANDQQKLGDPGKFLIPYDFPGKAECLALADLGASVNITPLSMWNKLSLPNLNPTCMTLELADRLISRPGGVAEDVYVKVGSFHFLADFVVVDSDADPRVPLILKKSFLKIGRALIDVFEGELTLRVGKEAITFNLDQTSRYSANYSDMMAKRIDVIDMACEEYSQEVLGLFDVISSGNPTPYYDLIVFITSPTLTSFRNSDILLEEVDAFLAIEDDPTSPEDDPTSPEVDQSYLDPEGDMLLLEAFLNDDPSLPPPTQGYYLPKGLSMEEKTTLITVLKSHKRAITWKLSDIKGIDPEFCTHKILMEEDFEPAVQYQRRVNPKIHDVIKQEVLKLLDAGLIYPISNSPWVSPVHSVPKKGGFTAVENEDNELILTRLVTGWRVCIDYRKLNEATRKDHFPLPFMDQMPEILAGNQYYYFLDGFSGYFQIPIDPKDQGKTTFTCPYGKFAYRRMPFGLCNAPGMFQRCMMAIFHYMIEKTLEVFMYDFSVFENSFQSCLSYIERMLKRCEDTNLCLNWEKSHFMVKEGIVLGHKISEQWIEVDKAKVDVITKLPHPTTVKGAENLAADHLSRLENPHQNVLDPKEINESFPLEILNLVSTRGNFSIPWFADFANYHAGNFVVKGMSSQQKSKFFKDVKHYFWDDPFLFKTVLIKSSEGVYQTRKPLKLSRLAAMDPSRDTMAQITQPKSLQIFEKSLCPIWNPRAIISDRGTHFCNDQFAKVMQNFGVTHCLATPYHPQTSGQVEVSNRSLKRILEWKVGENRVSWSDKLDDALWAFRTAYKTPIGCTPYKMVYEKACHLPIELEHKAYWVFKDANFDLKIAGDHRKVQLNELNELHDQAYENSLIYKEKTNKLHDSKIKNRVFNIGDRVLLFNSRLKNFFGKLKSRWSGPFTISQVYPYGTVELSQPDGPNFKVNGHRCKHYFGKKRTKVGSP
uniref:DNA-directed DNA polymerase n=1 Tax=Tanacetum cinerariifolium TaxID=118510 RepID=A0A6L2M2X8_TANCI|nr:DNA-directed DNA polymerase [Tanacetum cinerariifolium]